MLVPPTERFAVSYSSPEGRNGRTCFDCPLPPSKCPLLAAVKIVDEVIESRKKHLLTEKDLEEIKVQIEGMEEEPRSLKIAATYEVTEWIIDNREGNAIQIDVGDLYEDNREFSLQCFGPKEKGTGCHTLGEASRRLDIVAVGGYLGRYDTGADPFAPI